MVSILVGYMVSNNLDIIDFVDTPPFLRFALQVTMATMHFNKALTCVSFRNIFSYLGVPRSNLGARKAKLDNIRSIDHRFTFFRKTGHFGSTPFGPKKCLKVQSKNPFKRRYELAL